MIVIVLSSSNAILIVCKIVHDFVFDTSISPGKKLILQVQCKPIRIIIVTIIRYNFVVVLPPQRARDHNGSHLRTLSKARMMKATTLQEIR